MPAFDPQTLFDQLSAAGYHLSEAEAKVFLPGLVEKSGQPQVGGPWAGAFCRPWQSAKWQACARPAVPQGWATGMHHWADRAGR